MSYAKDIIKRARKNIIDHIHYEIGLIDLAVNAHHDADEEPYTSEEDWLYNPVISDCLDDSYRHLVHK